MNRLKNINLKIYYAFQTLQITANMQRSVVMDALKQILLKMSKEVVSYGKSATQEVAGKIMNSIMGLGVALTKTVANNYLNGTGD